MDKRKLNVLYVVLGIIGFILFNYPVVHLLIGKIWFGLPAILIYFLVLAIVISIAGFIITQINEE
ncbi:MAG: hypothetical protein KA394_03950 [Fluviicola sp.]|jgi:hypothetical protein|uniref:hypothetical protein n=1 Tax=Fluviicola sp. TaxID=1917219 RepID=UPI001B512146|nr:hypothetical protein [Fluviicola sp.]